MPTEYLSVLYQWLRKMNWVTRLKSTAVVLLALCLGSSAHAQGTDFHQGSTYQKVMEHGKSIMLGYYYELNPDCTSVGDFKVYTTSQPQGGRVTYVQTVGFPTYPTSNIRSKCDSRRVNVTKVFYKAFSKFVGNDSFVLQSVTSGGNPINFNIQISVR